MWTKRAPRYNELDDYLAQVAPIEADLSRLVDGLSDSQMAWRPGPKRWSIAESLEHLNITAARFLPAVDRAMGKGRAEGLLASGPFLHPGFSDWIVR